jgi:hypothetical protein
MPTSPDEPRDSQAPERNGFYFGPEARIAVGSMGLISGARSATRSGPWRSIRRITCKKWKICRNIFHFLFLGYAHNGKDSEIHPKPHLKRMDQVRQVLRYHHYALTTERTYLEKQ